MRLRCAEEISIGFSFKTLLSVALLAGYTAAPPAHASHTPPPSSEPELTVKEASILLKNANRATEEVMSAGTPLAIPLDAEQCENILTKQKHIVSLSTYHTAQKIMMKAGRLTAETAAMQLENQKKFAKHANDHLPALTKSCAVISHAASDISKSGH